MSLIKTDMDGIKKYAQKLNAGDLYPLFACMLTARTWDSINEGIDKKELTEDEVFVNALNAGILFLIFLSSADFFKINIFEIFFQECHLTECRTVCCLMFCRS